MKLTRRQLRRLILESGVPAANRNVPGAKSGPGKGDDFKRKIIFPEYESKLTDDINKFFNNPLAPNDAIIYGSDLDNSQIAKLQELVENLEENVENINSLCDRKNKYMSLSNKNYRYMLNKTADDFFETFRSDLQEYLRKNWHYKANLIEIRNNGTERNFKAASTATEARVAGSNHGLKLANDVRLDIPLPEADGKIANFDFVSLIKKYGVSKVSSFPASFKKKYKDKLEYIISLTKFKEKGSKARNKFLNLEYVDKKPSEYIESINDLSLETFEPFLSGKNNKNYNNNIKKIKSSVDKADFKDSAYAAKKIYFDIVKISKTISTFNYVMNAAKSKQRFSLDLQPSLETLDFDFGNVDKDFIDVSDYRYSTGTRNKALARNRKLVKLINKFVQEKYKDDIVWGAAWDGKKTNPLEKGIVRPGSRGELEFHHFEFTPKKAAEIINQDAKLKNALSLIKSIKETGYGIMDPLEIDFNVASLTGNDTDAMDNRRNLYIYCIELSNAYFGLSERNEEGKINSLIEKFKYMIQNKKAIFKDPEKDQELLSKEKTAIVKESLIRSLIRKKLKRYYT